jgi:hypothetical protein
MMKIAGVSLGLAVGYYLAGCDKTTQGDACATAENASWSDKDLNDACSTCVQQSSTDCYAAYNVTTNVACSAANKDAYNKVAKCFKDCGATQEGLEQAASGFASCDDAACANLGFETTGATEASAV